MAKDVVTVEAIAAAIEKDGLRWTAGETELTALSAAEQRQRLGLIVTPEQMASLTAETARTAAVEGLRLGVGVGAPAAVDWRTGGLRDVDQEPGELWFVRVVLQLLGDRVGRADQAAEPRLRDRPVRGFHAVLRWRQLQRVGTHVRACRSPRARASPTRPACHTRPRT